MIIGFIIGIGKIIPGVSGSMIAISLGIYNKLIESILNPKKNIKFIAALFPGFILAIVFGSKIITYLLNNYYFLTMIFFIGLISGGLPKIIFNLSKKTNYKNIIVFFISLLIPLLLTLSNNSLTNTNLSFFTIVILGFIESITTIVPGISGTAILMIIGYYDEVMNFFNNLLNLTMITSTIKFGIPYGIGIILGAFIISKIVNYMIKNYENIFYSMIAGLAISSIILMFKSIFTINISLITLIESIILLTSGFVISLKFDK